MTAVRFSIVILTYARDAVLAQMIDRLAHFIADRPDTEVVLVDNNPPDPARARLLAPFARSRIVGEGINKGVVARNDGFAAAQGEIIVLLDDDVFVETCGFLDLFAQAFDADDRLGAVTIRKHVRGETRRRVDLIPHTDKSVDLDRAFDTFRFVGGCVGFRAAALADVGGFLPDFFYGLEEIELSYRLIDRQWKIRYLPDIVAEELEHPAGRRPARAVQTDRLANKYIITFLRMPFPWIVFNFLLFTPYLVFFARGEVSVVRAIAKFMTWLGRADRLPRKPIGAAAVGYIRACGGVVWR